MVQKIPTPKTHTYSVDHITEEKMNKYFKNIYSWVSDKDGIIEVTTKEERLTKQKLLSLFLFWQPEITFYEYDDKQIIMEVDPYNNHIYYSVKYQDGSLSDPYDDIDDAIDLFLKEEE